MENQKENQKKQEEILKTKAQTSNEEILGLGRKFIEELKAKGPNEESLGKTFVIQTFKQKDIFSESMISSNCEEEETGLASSKRRELMKLRIEIINEFSEKRELRETENVNSKINDEVNLKKRDTKVSFDHSKKWVDTGNNKGYYEYIFAVCGANDTGLFENSPCPSDIRVKEIDDALKVLNINGIPTEVAVGETSNKYCLHYYVIVPPEYHRKAKIIFNHYMDYSKTKLIYPVEN